MKITDVRLRDLGAVRLSQPIAPAWVPGAVWPSITPSYLEMHTDEGIAGVGPAVDRRLLETAIALYVEIFHKPPGLPVEIFQLALAEPFLPNGDGDIVLPSRPGLGVDVEPELSRVR